MSRPVAEIIATDLSYGRFILKNNTSERFDQNYYLEWFLELAGYVIDKGILEIDAEPMGEKPFGFTHQLPDKGLCTVLFSVISKNDTNLGPRESEFAFAQFILREDENFPELTQGNLPMKAEQTESLYVAHSPVFAVAFSKKSFLPLTMVCDGKEILSAPASWVSKAPVTLYRPAMRGGTALAHFNGLWVEQQGDTPLSAGSIEWIVNGEGKILLHIIPARQDSKITLSLPLLPVFDYMDYFAQVPGNSCDGQQSGTVLSRESGSPGKEKLQLCGMRELAVSSGEVTLSMKAEHPIACQVENWIFLTFDCENKILFSLETEHM